MRKLMIVFLTFVLFTQVGISQSDQSRPKLTKQEKKAQKKAEQLRKHQEFLALVGSQNFVIEADRLTDRYGNSIFLNSTTNFISLIDSTVTVQLGFDGSFRGSNGLGGFTVDSNLRQFEIVEDRPNKGIRFRMQLFGTALSGTDIRIDLNSSGFTTATLNTIRGGRFTLHGQLVPLENSRVYKGFTVF